MEIFTWILVSLLVLGLLTLFILAYGGFWFYPILYGSKRRRTRVACLGDSCTYGMFLMNWFWNAWPHRLNRMLKDFQVINFGQNKASASSKAELGYHHYHKHQLALRSDADIFLVSFGTNDSKPWNWLGREAFRSEYLALLEQYHMTVPKAKFVLLTPPFVFERSKKKPPGMGFYGVRSREVAVVREVILDIAREQNLVAVDIYKLTEGREDLFAFDGVHLNAKGTKLVADTLAPVLEASIK